LKRISDGVETKVVLPPNAKVSVPRRSPDGNQFAFMNTIPNGIELYVGDTSSAKIRKIAGVAVDEKGAWCGPGAAKQQQGLIAAGKNVFAKKCVRTRWQGD
jgi:hypothetical protein